MSTMETHTHLCQWLQQNPSLILKNVLTFPGDGDGGDGGGDGDGDDSLQPLCSRCAQYNP